MILYLTEGLINESVSGGEVTQAIRGREGVLITYNDETGTSHEGVRYIEPYVFGTTKKGNPCIRAYQYYGDTKRGVPKWKLFRLDRITSWKPSGEKFELEPQARGWAAEAYNNNGDNSMSNVYLTVDLGEEKPLTDYERLKAKTRQLQNGQRVNIAQMQPTNNTKTQSYIQTQQKPKENGPVNDEDETENQVKVRQNSPVDMETKTETQPQETQPQQSVEAEKPTARQEGPINDKPQANSANDTKPMSDEAFRQMIQRNLEITRQEKERRNQRKFGSRV